MYEAAGLRAWAGLRFERVQVIGAGSPVPRGDSFQRRLFGVVRRQSCFGCEIFATLATLFS